MATGKEIKRLRGKDVTASKAAKFIGVGVDRLRKWEERDTDPVDTGDRAKIEAYFGVKLDQLHTVASFDFVEKKPAGGLQEAAHAPMLEILMQKLIQVTDTTNRLLERQEKGLLEKVDRVDANLNVVVAQTEKIGVELESGRMVALMALSRLEKKPVDELIHEADNIKIDLLKARDELYTSSVKDRSSTGKEK